MTQAAQITPRAGGPMGGALLGICLLVLLAMVPAPVRAEGAQDRPVGLMWNRTGLPLVFPLLIKTLPGRDYHMVLTDAETGTEALAAYIIGGEFFRVLVPPGTYFLRFAYGLGWLDEERLFGPGDETGFYDLPEPLTFRVIGVARKAGHIVDLRRHVGPGDTMAAIDGALVEGLSICQGLHHAPDPDDFYSDPDRPSSRSGPKREAVRDLGPQRPALRYDPYATPDYETRSYVCY